MTTYLEKLYRNYGSDNRLIIPRRSSGIVALDYDLPAADRCMLHDLISKKIVSLRTVSPIDFRFTINLSLGLSASDYDYDYREDHDYPARDTVETFVTPIIEDCIPMVDMFGTVEREIVTAYVDGQLQVVITAILDHVQVRAFNTGVCRIPGIAACTLDNFAPFSEENTAFILRFNPSINANRCESIRKEVRQYATQYLENLLATPVQASLF